MLKKIRHSHLFSALVAMLLAFTLTAQPIAAFAAEADDIASRVAAAEEAALDEMNNVILENTGLTRQWVHQSYYPSSGATSGYFSGKISDYATFNNLPSGTMQFAYSISGGEANSCYLRFYVGNYPIGTSFRTVNLNANSYTGSGSIDLPYSGTYTVELVYLNGSNDTQIIFAYNLFRVYNNSSGN